MSGAQSQLLTERVLRATTALRFEAGALKANHVIILRRPTGLGALASGFRGYNDTVERACTGTTRWRRRGRRRVEITSSALFSSITATGGTHVFLCKA